MEDPDFVHVEDPIHSSGFDGMQHLRRLGMHLEEATSTGAVPTLPL